MTWHIANIRDANWYDEGPFGVSGNFQRDEHFDEFGFNFAVVWPGQPVAMYHREANQEGFLVLAGECLAIVEGEEHPMRQWDYLHCPAETDHIIVGAGDGPAFLIAVGGRTGEQRDRVSGRSGGARPRGRRRARDRQAARGLRPRSLTPRRPVREDSSRR